MRLQSGVTIVEKSDSKNDPISNLLQLAEVDLADIAVRGWPDGVQLSGYWGSGPLYFNIGCQSPEWVTQLLKNGHQGELVLRAILVIVSAGHALMTPRFELEHQLRRLVRPWLFRAN